MAICASEKKLLQKRPLYAVGGYKRSLKTKTELKLKNRWKINIKLILKLKQKSAKN